MDSDARRALAGPRRGLARRRRSTSTSAGMLLDAARSADGASTTDGTGRLALPSCRSVRTRRTAKPIAWRFSRAGMSRRRPGVTASAARSSWPQNGGPSCRAARSSRRTPCSTTSTAPRRMRRSDSRRRSQLRCFRKPIVPTISRAGDRGGHRDRRGAPERRREDPRRDQARADDLQRRARRSSQLPGARPRGT